MPAAHVDMTQVGIGLRGPHVQALLDLRPALGCVQVHSENYFAQGGAALQTLYEVRGHYAVSLHGVGLSLGSACGVDEAHLRQLAQLAHRIEPLRVSDHASFARVVNPGTASGPPQAVHAGDLLPLPLTGSAQDVLVHNIQQVQDTLRRPLLIENLSAYMAYEDDDLNEVDFLVGACRRSGCQLLLDLNNLVVNGLNRVRRQAWVTGGALPDPAQMLQQARAQALDWVWSLPPEVVGEVHLAGFRWPTSPDHLVIDDHSQRVSPTVWDVYDQALAHLGRLPTVIEWDTDLPPLAVLLDDARLAGEHLAACVDAAEP